MGDVERIEEMQRRADTLPDTLKVIEMRKWLAALKVLAERNER